AARILFAWPPKRCPRWSDAELSPGAEGRFRSVLWTLREIPRGVGDTPLTVAMEPAARDRFRRLSDEFARAGEEYDGGPMPPVLSKAARMALRLALVHHVVT